jgi:hypothetical protein
MGNRFVCQSTLIASFTVLFLLAVMSISAVTSIPMMEETQRDVDYPNDSQQQHLKSIIGPAASYYDFLNYLKYQPNEKRSGEKRIVNFSWNGSLIRCFNFCFACLIAYYCLLLLERSLWSTSSADSSHDSSAIQIHPPLFSLSFLSLFSSS